MSTRPVSGQVSNVSQKDFPDRNTGKNIKLYSFQLEGSNQWFRTGQDPIPFGTGQTVQFVADGQKVDVRSMTGVQALVQAAPHVAPTVNQNSVSTASAQSSAAAPSATTRTANATRGPASKDEYWANKEAHDREKEVRFQSVNEPRMALSVGVEAASRVVSSALAHDALGFGTTAKSKRIELLGDFVEEIALRFATFIHNAPENLKNYKESIPVEVKGVSSSVDSQE